MKLLLAFITGAALAGGLVYWSLKPAPPEMETETRVETQQIPVQDLIPEATPAPAIEPAPAPAPPPQRPKPRRQFQPPIVSVSQKISAPMPSPPVVRPAVAEGSLPTVAVLASNAVVPPPPEPNRVTIAGGTILNVRLSEDLSSETNVAGDLFSASLDLPLIVDGFIIAERGARVMGHVVGTQRSGKVKGSAVLILQLTGLETADGQTIEIQTETFTKAARSQRGKDIAKVGAAASIGAAIGAAVGGGSGAAIGAAIGGAAGTGGILLTKGAPAALPVETRIPFRLNTPVEVVERIY
jgi:hypothetical protein